MNLYKVIIYEGSRELRAACYSELPSDKTPGTSRVLPESVKKKLQDIRSVVSVDKITNTMSISSIETTTSLSDSIKFNGYCYGDAPDGDHCLFIIDMDFNFSKKDFIKSKYDIIKAYLRNKCIDSVLS